MEIPMGNPLSWWMGLAPAFSGATEEGRLIWPICLLQRLCAEVPRSGAVVSSFLIRLLGWTDETDEPMGLFRVAEFRLLNAPVLFSSFFQGECTCSAQYMGCWLNMGYPQNPVAWKLILLNQQGHSLWVNPCFQTVTWLRSVSCFPLLAFAESAGLVIHLLSNPVF